MFETHHEFISFEGSLWSIESEDVGQTTSRREANLAVFVVQESDESCSDRIVLLRVGSFFILLFIRKELQHHL
jgi:hypothetical protein